MKKGRPYINFSTCIKCGETFDRPNNGTKMSYVKCPKCVLDAAVARKERRTKHGCAECKEVTRHSKLVPHNGQLICGACYRHITTMQDAEFTMDEYLESQNVDSSGLGECGANPVNDKQRRASRISEYKGGAKKKARLINE